jgi:glycosyltransferase involved in cell wall biosynthesis
MVALASACCERGHRLYCVWEAEPTNAVFKADLAAAGAESLVMPATGRPARFLAEMALWLHRTGIDVMYGHFNPASLLALAAARLVQVPLPLCMVHTGFWGGESVDVNWRSRLVIRARRSLAARVHTCCRAVGDEILGLHLGGRAMQPFYLGVSIPEFKRPRSDVRRELGFTETDLVVACVAYHGLQKGLDILLRAVALVARRVPAVRVVQVGGGPDVQLTESLKSLAEEVGVSRHVIWTGLRNDVPDILSAADVYCQPSRWEGLPLAIMEAMLEGLPVVATRVNGVCEAVEEEQSGILVEPESPEALAEGLVRMLRDAPLRRRMGERSRQRGIEMFLLERQVRFLIDRYEHMWRAIRF